MSDEISNAVLFSYFGSGILLKKNEYYRPISFKQNRTVSFSRTVLVQNSQGRPDIAFKSWEFPSSSTF